MQGYDCLDYLFTITDKNNLSKIKLFLPYRADANK